MGQNKTVRGWKIAVSAATVFAFAGLAFAQSGFTYKYDGLGRVTEVTYPNGNVVAYTYDAADNRTQKVTTAGAGAPAASNVSANVAHNTATGVSLSVAGSYTSVSVPSGPSHGSTSISGTTITYTPTTGYSGSDSFTYTATGPGGTSSAATASLTVAAASSGFSQTIQITGSGPVDLRALANSAGYNGAQNATITFEVGNGVTIMGDPGGGVGVDTGTWPSGYTASLTLVVKNGGKVYGGGGNGGPGGAPGVSSSSGGIGGDAVYARAPMSVTVQSGGVIAGGGGGGDGGGGIDWWDPQNYWDWYMGGGGGGGGFPNGAGGAGGTTDNPWYSGYPGNAGADGTTSGGGTGGDGQSYNGNYAYAGAAGNGAGYGGYAIRKNGNSVPVSNSGTITGSQQ